MAKVLLNHLGKKHLRMEVEDLGVPIGRKSRRWYDFFLLPRTATERNDLARREGTTLT